MEIENIQLAVQAGSLKAVKTAMYRGYVSRKIAGYVSTYKGKYGSGYCVYRPNWGSTRYSYVTYYVQVAA